MMVSLEQETYTIPSCSNSINSEPDIRKEWLLKTDYTKNGKTVVSQSSTLGHFGLLFVSYSTIDDCS